MCGIAGIVTFKNSEDVTGLLNRMMYQLKHRGPDAKGVYINPPAGLAHTRLSIIDLSGGNQPIHNEDQSIWVTFNGEIFNYPDLRNMLIAKGHSFYTKTDTEILVHMYESFGTDLFHHLNGQFSFAIWDKNREILLMGRDRIGIRPLFYHFTKDRLVFASEIKAIFEDKSIERKLSPKTLSSIFTCWTPMESETPFEGIKQLPPGHFALFSKDNFQTQAYWNLPFGSSDQTPREFGECLSDFQELMLDSARIRLRADVPVGAYLSGGIDSTFISSLVKKNFNNLLRTFSVQFTNSEYDETKFQMEAVNALGTDHRSIRCDEKDIGELFRKVIWHTETPILRTAPAPLMMLSKLVRENNFKVVLTGEGADELFAGYNIFKENRIRRFWSKHPHSQIRPLLLKRLYPYIFNEKNERNRTFMVNFFRKNLEMTNSSVYSHLIRWNNTHQILSFFKEDFRQEMDSLEHFIEKFSSTLPPDFQRSDPLSRAQYIEIKLFLSNYLLSSQGDRMAMANSVEGRYPFLDYRMIEFAARLNPHFRLNGLTEKYIIKEASKNMIPERLIKRAKQPYRAPISRCFFGPKAPDYVMDLLSEENLKKCGYFDETKVFRLIHKIKTHEGDLLSERENMAIVGIISTLLLDTLFIKDFQRAPDILEMKD